MTRTPLVEGYYIYEVDNSRTRVYFEKGHPTRLAMSRQHAQYEEKLCELLESLPWLPKDGKKCHQAIVFEDGHAIFRRGHRDVAKIKL